MCLFRGNGLLIVPVCPLWFLSMWFRWCSDPARAQPAGRAATARRSAWRQGTDAAVPLRGRAWAPRRRCRPPASVCGCTDCLRLLLPPCRAGVQQVLVICSPVRGLHMRGSHEHAGFMFIHLWAQPRVLHTKLATARKLTYGRHPDTYPKPHFELLIHDVHRGGPVRDARADCGGLPAAGQQGSQARQQRQAPVFRRLSQGEVCCSAPSVTACHRLSHKFISSAARQPHHQGARTLHHAALCLLFTFGTRLFGCEDVCHVTVCVRTQLGVTFTNITWPCKHISLGPSSENAAWRLIAVHLRSFEDDRGSLLGRAGARQRLSMDRAVNAPALRSASIDEDSQADPETVRR